MALDPGPIYLIGFMATGKSTVGREVATRLGRRFVDLDAEVEARERATIPELFKQFGEAWFREREAAALAALAEEPDLVVATGGGAPCHGKNLGLMHATGLVVGLAASMETVLARALGPGAPVRPLLAGGREAAERLFADRAAVYARADFTVRTDGRDVKEIAKEVVARARLRLGDVCVHLPGRAYPIQVGALAGAGALAEEMFGPVTRVAVVTDENVARAGHAEAVRRALAEAGVDREPALVTMPAGEQHKTLAQAEKVALACVAAGLDRRSAIVAVGGGVVGDLAGFVAATLFRGVQLGQVPTTLLAMVDSAIGGKTAVDLAGGKNLVGAFWQPRFVLAAPQTLATLPRRELVAAHGEVLKYALIGDPAQLDLVQVDAPAEKLAETVRRCAAQKARVVAADELEQTGLRAVLNLGHTVGHAIESASLAGQAGQGSGPLLHGEAVALGLVAAARVSRGAGVAGPELEPRVAEACARLGLPHDLTPWLGDEVMQYLSMDKKRAGAKVRFVALERPGTTRTVELTPAEIVAFLRSPKLG